MEKIYWKLQGNSKFVKYFKGFWNGVENLISPSQHGFVRGRSTTTNYLIITQFVFEFLDKKGQVDVIYTDFSEAIGWIDYILLHKLSNMFVWELCHPS